MSVYLYAARADGENAWTAVDLDNGCLQWSFAGCEELLPELSGAWEDTKPVQIPASELRERLPEVLTMVKATLLRCGERATPDHPWCRDLERFVEACEAEERRTGTPCYFYLA